MGVLRTLVSRSALVAVVALVWALTAAQSQARPGRALPNLEALYEGLSTAVVSVQVVGDDGGSIGSGVLLHADGFVVTAAHVVEDSDEVIVEFVGGQQTKASIVTLSRTEDLALLRIGRVPKGAFVAKLANSDRLRVGQPVFCIGAPLGLKHTLTTGIVSAIRDDYGDELSMMPRHVIQTDAAINQGNSGGALFSEAGEVIGIASFIASRTGDSAGLGFAVPSNTVFRRMFVESIPYFGLVLRRIPKPLAELLHWPYHDALLVESVRPGSDAAQAGLRGGYVDADFSGVKVLMGGDLIVQVGTHPLSDAKAVHQLLTKLKGGDTIQYTVMRGGKLLSVDVKLSRVERPPLLAPPVGRRRKR